MKRLTWLIGPPGAGKSTFAKQGSHGFSRVVEFNRLLFPLIRNTKITTGILTANHQLLKLIRDLELRPENMEEKPLLVVAGILDADFLFPISDNEEVWLILPEKQVWKKQFEMRPSDSCEGKDYYEAYTDFSKSEKWYNDYATWIQKGLPVKKIETMHNSLLLGKRHYD